LGPIALFDKSALQALSADEAVWLEAHFLSNVTPLFYVETLADLEKAVAGGRTPEAVVGALVAKTPSNAAPNVYHRALISAELQGNVIDMGGRIIVPPGEYRRAPDGSLGMHIEEFPEAAMLRRWKAGAFNEAERQVARAWRAQLAEHDPKRMIGIVRNIVPAATSIPDLGTLKGVVDTFCESREREVLLLAFQLLDLPEAFSRTAFQRWEAAGRPFLPAFAPYTTHVLKVDLLYYLGIERGFISGERASNKIDMAYLYYLPFAMVFASGDKLHQRTAPLFLRAEQSFVRATDLKLSLAEIDGHCDALPDEIKQLGVLQFAHFPPSTVTNVVTELWDKHMRADWRQVAATREAERGKRTDTGTDEGLLSGFTSRVHAAEPLAKGEALLSIDDADYLILSRHVPFQKGKWRMVSKEVEEAERET
jgi:hypothetical protein